MRVPGSVVALLMQGDHILCVTRRNKLDDLGLPGGSIEDSDASPEAAMCRELREETGVEAVSFEFAFDRVDATDGNVARCFLVYDWDGEPHQMEPGIHVVWATVERLLDTRCTFREYNRKLFEHMGLLKVVDEHVEAGETPFDEETDPVPSTAG